MLSQVKKDKTVREDEKQHEVECRLEKCCVKEVVMGICLCCSVFSPFLVITGPQICSLKEQGMWVKLTLP